MRKREQWKHIIQMVKRKERRENALALRAEEGRGKLRKAAGNSKHIAIRRYPNGAIRMGEAHTSYTE